MKTVILAGGKGTRLGKNDKPKPMVEIGGRPILDHIIFHYNKYGYREFIIAAGYQGEQIVEYYKYNRNVTVIDTGLDTPTGGRIKKLYNLLDDTFFLTYGDGVSDINLARLREFHDYSGRIATVTVVHPPARFGNVEIGQDDEVLSFAEKKKVGSGWLNAGFFVMEPNAINFMKEDRPLESFSLSLLASEHQLSAYRYYGFWQCMDTPRDVEYLNNYYGGK